MTHPTSARNWQDVDGLEGFVAYLYLLAAEARQIEQGVGAWRNTTIPDFLTAIDTLLVVSRNQPALGNPEPAEPTMSTWRELAALLHAATIEPFSSTPLRVTMR